MGEEKLKIHLTNKETEMEDIKLGLQYTDTAEARIEVIYTLHDVFGRILDKYPEIQKKVEELRGESG